MEKLYVIADPILTGLHPLHENRYITTSQKTETAIVDGLESWEFTDQSGKIIAEMTDCEDQASYARAFAAAPEMIIALQKVLAKFCYLEELEARGMRVEWREIGAEGQIAACRDALCAAIGNEGMKQFMSGLYFPEKQ